MKRVKRGWDVVDYEDGTRKVRERAIRVERNNGMKERERRAANKGLRD
jgi:hypothetical protein